MKLRIHKNFFDIFPYGKGATFRYIVAIVFNIMSSCREGTECLARCGWWQGTGGPHPGPPRNLFMMLSQFVCGTSSAKAQDVVIICAMGIIVGICLKLPMKEDKKFM